MSAGPRASSSPPIRMIPRYIVIRCNGFDQTALLLQGTRVSVAKQLNEKLLDVSRRVAVVGIVKMGCLSH